MDQGVYRIGMDGRWELKDLYEFPHAFMQVYAFTYCFDSHLPPLNASRIDHALETYPWRGGYSVANMYTVLQNQVMVRDRPQIAEIRYASPGWIDILLNLHPAVKVATSVAAIAGSLAAATKAYAAIQKTLYDIRARPAKAKIERIQLARQEVQELQRLSEDLADAIGFEGLQKLNHRADIEVTAKLLSAQFKRLKALVDYVQKGKASLPLRARDDD